jgi:hypothetical protein
MKKPIILIIFTFCIKLFVAAQPIIYAVTPEGNLNWYKHIGYEADIEKKEIESVNSEGIYGFEYDLMKIENNDNFGTVRLEMENCRLTTTQDMFLERVGITNSFNDDNEFRFTPFFVSQYTNPINKIQKFKSSPFL